VEGGTPARALECPLSKAIAAARRRPQWQTIEVKEASLNDIGWTLIGERVFVFVQRDCATVY
jgi:hypothetical protein